MGKLLDFFTMRREAQLRKERMRKLFDWFPWRFKEVGEWQEVRLDKMGKIKEVLESGTLFDYVPCDKDCDS